MSGMNHCIHAMSLSSQRFMAWSVSLGSEHHNNHRYTSNPQVSAVPWLGQSEKRTAEFKERRLTWKFLVLGDLVAPVLRGQRLFCCVVFLQKNLNASRPSQHPPVSEEKCQRLHGI